MSTDVVIGVGLSGMLAGIIAIWIAPLQEDPQKGEPSSSRYLYLMIWGLAMVAAGIAVLWTALPPAIS